jgi:hypothetical protein
MPKPTAGEPKKKKTQPPRQPPSTRIIMEAERPGPMHDGATHFRLRKGGRQGQPCAWTAPGGVQSEDIPIELFTTEEIRRRWGNAEYGFAFTRQEETGVRTPLGGWRKTTLSEPEEEAPHASRHPTTSIVPTNGANAFEGPMSLLMALRDLSRDEVTTQVAMVREQAASQTSMFLECLRVVQQARTPPAESEAMTLVREELRATRQQMERMQERFLERLDPEDPEEPEEPSREDDEAKVKRLAGIVKRDGAMAAVQQFLGDESAATFVRLLPRIKAMMPEIARTLGPMLRDLLSDPPAPPAPPAPVAAVQPPPSVPPPAPRPPRRVRDEHTPKVQ